MGRKISILVAIVGFFVVTDQPVLAQTQDAYYTYQFHVFCKDEQIPAAILFVRGTGTMGTSPIICVGACDGRTVSVDEATAELSATVLSGFRAQYEQNERNAAAGKARSVAQCIGGDWSRKCDESQACEAISKALEAVKQARTAVGSWEVRLNKLKNDLLPLLTEIEPSICKDNHYPHYELNQVRLALDQTKAYDGSKYPGANEYNNAPKLEEIDRRLKNLENAMCKGGQKSEEALSCAPARGDGSFENFAPPLDTRYMSDAHKQLLPKVDWGEFMPSQSCPGCAWQLLSVWVDELSSKPGAAPYKFWSIWRCPSSNTVVKTHKLRR